MIKLISSNKLFIFSLISLLIAFALAANSSEYHHGEIRDSGYNTVVETNWGFVCMSIIFTLAGVVEISYWLLKSKDKQ